MWHTEFAKLDFLEFTRCMDTWDNNQAAHSSKGQQYLDTQQATKAGPLADWGSEITKAETLPLVF